jgi:cysteine synthase
MRWLPSNELPHWLQFLKSPTARTTRHVLWGVLLGVSLSIASTSLALEYQRRKKKREEEGFEWRPIQLRSDEILGGVIGLIGMRDLNKSGCDRVTEGSL